MERRSILIAGANGYVGSRLVIHLAELGMDVIALVRSKDRFKLPKAVEEKVKVIEADLLDPESLKKIPEDIACAYYLVHSLASKEGKFYELEKESAHNFRERIDETSAEKIVYLSGLSVGEDVSEHMRSRHNVQEILSNGRVPLVTFRAAIIIGSGSASFELMRDLVEKLPIMIAPRWVSSKCQPIGIVDILYYLIHVIDVKCDKNLELQIGGPDVLTYKEMMYRFAKVRKLKRWIISVPVLTPRLSSLWLYFVTSSNLFLAKRLIDSLTTDAVCQNKDVDKVIPHKCMTYEETIERAFDKIEQNHVLSSWKDALNISQIKPHIESYMNVPEHGCLTNAQVKESSLSKEDLTKRIWSVGGRNGWFYMNWAWRIRGLMDKCVGGVGLRRGRRSPTEITAGDSLDFWRVIKADKENGHLLLYAEMKVPGEAWLDWQIKEEGGKIYLHQTATFRPKGLFGRLYWYVLWPFHILIFSGMCRKAAKA